MQLSCHVEPEHGSKMKLRRLADHPQSKFLNHPAGGSCTDSEFKNFIRGLNRTVMATVRGVGTVSDHHDASQTIIRCTAYPAKLERTLPTYMALR
jgi:hypothetical protein